MTNKQIKTVEHYCLEMRYAHLRAQNRQTLEKLKASIGQNGQLVPVVIVPEGTNKWVLIDGYHRVKALKSLSKDTVEAEVWDCDDKEALLLMFTNRSTRPTGIFEEALLLHELHSQHGLSQNVLAARIGRDQSWISRRLSLVEHLSGSVLKALSEGSLSLWVAQRVLAPMARAIPEHANCLLNHLLKHSRSTRDMRLFYDHYQKSNRQTRTNMLEKPDLFFKAQHLLHTEKQTAALKKGPEGKWQSQCQALVVALSELALLAPNLFYRQTPEGCRQPLQEFKCVSDKLTELAQTIEKLTDADQKQA